MIPKLSGLHSRAGFRVGTACLTLCVALACAPERARADESGVSFWIPGFFGSLAATPQQPGWSLTSIYYHTDVSASGNAALAREIQIGQFNPTINVNANANVHAVADLGFVIPTYVFATPFLGGQASASVLLGYGSNNVSLNASATASTDSPPFSVSRSVALQQDTLGFADIIPMFIDRWNAGVNNYMVYLTGDIPVGLYSSRNLANTGLGHGAIDGGVGYTYFDEKAGHEFSAVAGLTGNFENHSTNYTSGIDFHLDWGAAQFLSKQVFVGLVGYVYDQITPDRGCAPILCPFESRVIGIGPQFGYIFPVGTMQGYFNIKGYGEFDNNARPDGWNLWLTFSLSPAPPTKSAAQSSPPPILTKSPRG
jgi:hypothetical protein